VDRGRLWLGLLILYLVWGSTYLGIAVAVDTIPPFLMAATRFAIGGAVLLAWSIARAGTAFIWPTPREWRDSLIVGGLLLGGGMGLVAWGEQTIPSGIAALLIALLPVWLAVLGRVLLGERLPRVAVVGIVVGFLGVALLVAPTILGEAGALEPFGLLALIVSPISWAVGSMYATNRASLPRQPLVGTGLQMVCGAAVLMVMAVANGEPARFDASRVSSDSVLALAYLTVIGSLLAFTVYGWLLRVAPLPFIATYAYVNPVVAVILGAVVLHEVIDPPTLVAGAVIVAAVALIVTARGRMRMPRSPSGAAEPRPSSPARVAPPERAS
jgi:drug/metabolite transporter (DMT)-like permease